MNKDTTKSKKLKNCAVALGIVGFLLLYSGVSTEDDRMKMSPERAKKELASPETTTSMMGIGLISMFGALALAKKAKESR